MPLIHQLHCIGRDSFQRRTTSPPSPQSACATQHSLIKCQLCAWDHKQPVLSCVDARKLNILDVYTEDKETMENSLKNQKAPQEREGGKQNCMHQAHISLSVVDTKRAFCHLHSEAGQENLGDGAAFSFRPSFQSMEQVESCHGGKPSR